MLCRVNKPCKEYTFPPLYQCSKQNYYTQLKIPILFAALMERGEMCTPCRAYFLYTTFFLKLSWAAGLHHLKYHKLDCRSKLSPSLSVQ